MRKDARRAVIVCLLTMPPTKRRASSIAASGNIKRQKEMLALEQAERAEKKIKTVCSPQEQAGELLLSQRRTLTDASSAGVSSTQISSAGYPSLSSSTGALSSGIDWFGGMDSPSSTALSALKKSSQFTPKRRSGQERTPVDYTEEVLSREALRRSLLDEANPPPAEDDENLMSASNQIERNVGHPASSNNTPAHGGRLSGIWRSIHSSLWYLSYASGVTMVLVLLVLLVRFVMRSFSPEADPFCSTDGARLNFCAPCPLHGSCDELGHLLSCKPGFTSVGTWGLLVGDKGPGRGDCVPTWGSWLWARARPWLPYCIAVSLLVAWALRRRWRRLAEGALVERWLATAWDLLNSQEGNIPLDWLKVKILRDEFGTAAAARQHEWLWTERVLPELVGDPRLRVEPRVVQGEHKECVSVLSPKALRRGGALKGSGTASPVAVVGAGLFTFGGGGGGGSSTGGIVSPVALENNTTVSHTPLLFSTGRGGAGGRSSREPQAHAQTTNVKVSGAGRGLRGIGRWWSSSADTSPEVVEKPRWR